MITPTTEKADSLATINRFTERAYKEMQSEVLRFAFKYQESLLFRIVLDHSLNPNETKLIHEFWSPSIYLALLKGKKGRFKILYATNEIPVNYIAGFEFDELVKEVQRIAKYTNVECNIKSCLTRISFERQRFYQLIDEVQDGELPHGRMLMYD